MTALTMLVTASVLLGLSAGPAFAQADPGANHTPRPGNEVLDSGIAKNADLGAVKAPSETSPSESNAVGGLGRNVDLNPLPPAMAKDCSKNPADCSDPQTTGSAQTGSPR